MIEFIGMDMRNDSSGMGNKKERYSRSIGYSSDEPVQRCKDISESWNTFSEEFEVNVGVHQGSV